MTTPNKESLLTNLEGISLKELLITKLSKIHQENGFKPNDKHPILSSELLNRTDAVENFWIPLYDEVKMEKIPEMDKEIAKYFLMLSMDEKTNKCAQAKQLIEYISMDKSVTFPYQFWTRILDGRFTFEISPALRVWMILNFQTPGIAIMEMTIFQYWYKIFNGRELTLEDLAMTMFPNGLFTEIIWNALWDCQKIQTESSVDNLLDKRVPMQSLIENIKIK